MKRLLPLFALALCISSANAQWTTNGPNAGAAITCMAANNSQIFVGIGSVFVSNNNGANWTSVGLPSSSCQSIAVRDSEIVLNQNSNGMFNVVFSTNGGNHWTSLYSPPIDPPAIITSVAMNTVNAAPGNINIFAGTNYGGGVYLVNGIQPWTHIGLDYAGIFALVSSDSNLFAGTDHGMFRSDTGNYFAWTAIDSGLPANITVNQLLITQGGIFAGTDSGIFVSVNNGNYWQSANQGLTNTKLTSLAGNSNTIYAGTNGGGVFVSTNNGASWSAMNNGLPDTVACLAVNSNGVFAGTTNNVYASTNQGARWTLSNDGLTTVGITAFATMGANIFAATEYYGIFLSGNNGGSWTPVDSNLPNTPIYSLAVSGSNIFAATTQGVYLSSNNGTSWKPANNGLAADIAYALVVDTSMGGGVTGIFVGTDSGVFMSTDNGSNWTPANNGLSEPVIKSLAIQGTNIFAGTAGGVFLSPNNGIGWTPASNGLPNYEILALAVNGNNIYAGTYQTGGSGLFLSTDNGSSWTGIGLNNNYVHELAFSGQYIFAAADAGVFFSNDNGNNWTNANGGLPLYTYASSLIINNDILFAGTGISGVWQQSVADVVAGIKAPPAGYQSDIKIFPNPSTSTFNFINLSNQCTIEIYNVLGQQVYSAPAVNSTYQLNMSSQAKGIYFYRVVANGGVVKGGKMVLE